MSTFSRTSSTYQAQREEIKEAHINKVSVEPVSILMQDNQLLS